MANRPIRLDKVRNRLQIELQKAFESASDRSKAESMKAYMKHLFPFYGIPSPLRTEISQTLFKKFNSQSEVEFHDVLREMWDMEEREWQYTAILFASKHKKMWTKSTISMFEQFLLSKSWWDSVDTLCSTCIVPYFKLFPDSKQDFMQKWESSGNIWLRRVCIIHQLTYKENTDLNYLDRIIKLNLNDTEFFIQKAIGWALRQQAKTNPEWVKRYVQETDLKPLSKREALKNLK